MSKEGDTGVESLLYYIQQHRGFDFSGYKRPSLTRRIGRRMQMLRIDSFDDYADYLEVHPEEFATLFNTILINVTSFFRDPDSWAYLAQEIIPGLLSDKKSSDPVRVWSAGCSSGQEAYTMAMFLAEAIGAEDFRQRVKIYATDVDEEALNVARQGAYSHEEMRPVDETLREKYFEPMNGRYCFRADLRRAVIFGRHDLTQDAPISRLDLLVCRNTLMYFNAETQGRILSRFHFALNEKGYLFLGRAELLLTHGNRFIPVDLKNRVFTRTQQYDPRDRFPGIAQAGNHELNRNSRPDRLTELALDSSPVARIVVDANGNLHHADQKARLLFSLNPKDFGRPLQDLEVSYRPVELRTLIEQAYAGRRSVTLAGAERRFSNGEVQYLDIVATPLYDQDAGPLGVAVSFPDVTALYRLQQELHGAKEEVQTASEELQTANEELETTNEELETTNEELQSTNEELETMNEELQSSNEELQTLNDELRQRTGELNHLNAFLQSILSGMRSGAVVLDQNLNVLVWNRTAEDLWGLREDEAKGQSLLHLDIGLPVEQLKTAIRPCLAGEAEQAAVVLDATTRRGKAIRCRVSCAPLRSADKQGGGVILLMEAMDP